jgi:hypothetical protein
MQGDAGHPRLTRKIIGKGGWGGTPHPPKELLYTVFSYEKYTSMK